MKQGFINKVKKISIEYQSDLEEFHRKYNGIYYTSFDLANKITEELFENKRISKIWDLKYLEPAVGIGNFVFSYLSYVSNNYKLSKKEVITLYENIYVCDNDQSALEIYKELFIESSTYFFNVNLPKNFSANIGDALIYNLEDSKSDYLDIESYFGDIKFDIIATNPPYKSLRAERRHYEDANEHLADRKNYEFIKKDATKRYSYSTRLNANIYMYFMEDIIEKYASNNAYLALLIPSSILSGRSTSAMRKHIIQSYNLERIGILNENNSHISANQGLTYLIIDKGSKTTDILISETDQNNYENTLKVHANDVLKRENSEIIIVNSEYHEILKAMESLPRIKDSSFINVSRGELDLTNNKEFIRTQKTEYPLIKGRNIQSYKLVDLDKTEFVDKIFIENSSKKTFISNGRIACQQISNMNKDHRLVFSQVPPNFVLGNSCNFIFVEDNNYGVTSDYLLGLLNSKLYNWYFKLFSSNNHINIYQLDELPIPLVSKKFIEEISKLAAEMNKETSVVIKEKIDKIVLEYFKSLKEGANMEKNLLDSKTKTLKSSKIDEDVRKGILYKKEVLAENGILNDHLYKLSDLDMEMIESIPEGGNWQDIPQETMNKSKRLLGIQKTGGRTTLYGRLKYDNPSYTITTYFNRPGNGCNIHPNQDRVLTTREGARLQGFPDDFYFHGNQRDILTQIGNAVPPHIGYLFGRNLKDHLNINKSIDLFAGAGGLTLGTKTAGIKSVLANDIDHSALVTLKINSPEIEVIHDDITKNEVKKQIIAVGLREKVELISGGPPCQGFSLAGARQSDDPRNKLVLDFAEIVEKVQPKAFLFENVVGLLSSEKGKTFHDLKILFEEIGYKIHAETLNFVEYGVPQKRKRVIIVGIRNEIKVAPQMIFPEKYTENLEDQVSVYESINDLDINLEEPISTSYYQKLKKKEITIEDYYDFLYSKKTNKQLNLF